MMVKIPTYHSTTILKLRKLPDFVQFINFQHYMATQCVFRQVLELSRNLLHVQVLADISDVSRERNASFSGYDWLATTDFRV